MVSDSICLLDKTLQSDASRTEPLGREKKSNHTVAVSAWFERSDFVSRSKACIFGIRLGPDWSCGYPEYERRSDSQHCGQASAMGHEGDLLFGSASRLVPACQTERQCTKITRSGNV